MAGPEGILTASFLPPACIFTLVPPTSMTNMTGCFFVTMPPSYLAKCPGPNWTVGQAIVVCGLPVRGSQTTKNDRPRHQAIKQLVHSIPGHYTTLALISLLDLWPVMLY